MKPLTPTEIEALRRRWREILKRAQEKGESPSAADIEAASASNDPIVAQLVVETEKAIEDHKRLLGRLKTNPKHFKPAATTHSLSLLINLPTLLSVPQSENKFRSRKN